MPDEPNQRHVASVQASHADLQQVNERVTREHQELQQHHEELQQNHKEFTDSQQARNVQLAEVSIASHVCVTCTCHHE